MTEIIIFKEKYGDRLFDVSTSELKNKVALKIVKERHKEGYWYSDLDIKWSEKKYSREKAESQFIKEVGLSFGQFKDLPVDSAIKKRFNETYFFYSKGQNFPNQDQCTFLRDALKGDGKSAWWLLQCRDKYEYEGYTFAKLEEV